MHFREAYGELEAENYKQLNISYEISRQALLGLWPFLLFKTTLTICGWESVFVANTADIVGLSVVMA